jgi:2-hydroxy-3-oxopropionate reductase
MEKIGFIGLGVMGMPMARNLLQAGYPLAVHDVIRSAVGELVKEGAREAFSPREIAQWADIIITMVPDGAVLEAITFGEGGILEGIGPGMVLIDMSSVEPRVSKKVAEALALKGAEMLDAPVSGGEPGAVAGTLSIMAGGKNNVFERVRPVFDVLGNGGLLIGPIGSGNIAKLANQIMVAINLISVAEGLVFAAKAGANPRLVFEAVKDGLAGSSCLNAKAPMILARNFKPGARLEIHIKDLHNALTAAHEVGAPLPFAALAMEVMQTLKALGEGQIDHGGVIRYFERLAGIEVKEETEKRLHG